MDKKFWKNFGWIELLFWGAVDRCGIGRLCHALDCFAVRVHSDCKWDNQHHLLQGTQAAGKSAPVLHFSGIISIIAGFVLVSSPVLGSRSFSLILAFRFIAHSISRTANYGLIRRVTGGFVHVLSVILNSLCILLGIFMLLNPLLLALYLGYLFAITVIVLGIDSIIEAFCRVRRRIDEDAMLEMESDR